ncbi:hypothetical protein ACIHCQ_25435 [Streptomyces sp. NPDC052236]|uniref:hypothetical protein n=1 Tax=Streptomyces sp. NPDC052236 TaxID=3365686 RepID=UPI0037D11222
MATIEDEVKRMFEDRSAFLEQPVEAEQVHSRVRRTRRRRAWMVASTAAVVAATTAIGISTAGEPGADRSSVAGGGTDSPTLGNLDTVGYAIERGSDGSVEVEFEEFFDSPGLIAKLRGLGITALPLTEGCPAVDGKLDRAAAERAVEGAGPRMEWATGSVVYAPDGSAVGLPPRERRKTVAFRLWPERMEDGYTLVVAAMSTAPTHGDWGGGGFVKVTGLHLNPGAETPTCLPISQ